MTFKALGTATLLCSFIGVASAQVMSSESTAPDPLENPVGIAGVSPRTTINYHGGPVLGTASEGPVRIYLIFYGDWAGTDPKGPGLMEDFFKGLGGSKYWNIFTSYKKPSPIKNQITLAGTHTDTGSQGKNLSNAGLQAVVAKAISSGALPAETNAIYHVVTSKEISQAGNGFCGSYCGFHTNANIAGKDIKFAFTGNPEHCSRGVGTCNGVPSNDSKSPNSDPGVDAMISILAHETGEAVTDPNPPSGYTFSSGYEEGDQCAYTYGSTFSVGNGSKANVKLGGRDFLIQQSWIASGSQRCGLSY